MTPLLWHKWLKRPSLSPSTPNRIGRGARGRRFRPPILERLEDRLTPSSNLDIVGRALSYSGSAVNNGLTVSVAGTAPTSLYTFTDSGEAITLGAGALAAGWTGSGTNTVQGASSTVSSIDIDLGDGNDTANIQSVNAPTALTGGSGTNTVNVCSNAPTNTGNLNGVNADLTVTASNGGTDTLNVSNFGAAAGDSNVVVGPSAITGFAGPTGNHTIDYTTATGGSFTLVHLFGSNSPTLPESFTLQSPGAPFRLDSESGPDTANVQSLSASATLNMGNGNNAINVSSDAPGHLGNLDGLQASLTITAGTGVNTLNVSDYGHTSGPVNATLTSSQITGLAPATIAYKAVGGSFGSIQVTGSNTQSNHFTINSTLTGSPTTVVGGTAVDSFTLGSATAAVAINGVSGNDTLTGADATNAWSITGGDAGSVNTKATFTNIENLTGGSGNDDFIFSNGQSVTGAVNGGGGTDTLDYSADTSPVFVNLGTGTATGVGTFSSIENVIGGSATADTLTGDDGGDTFDVTGTNSGDVNGPAAFTFSSFEDLVGGSGNDSFVFTGSALLTGSLDGGTGANSLSYAGFGQAVPVQLTGSDANGFTGTQAASIGGTFQHISTLIGSSGANQLTGENVNSTWDLNAASTYFDGANTLNFSSFEMIQGGSGDDTFNVLPQQTQPWTIDGGPPVLPALPGDVLNINLTAATGAQQTVTTPGDGNFTFTNRSTVTYTSIETINATGGQFALTLDMAAQGFQDGNPTPDVVNVSTDTNASQDSGGDRRQRRRHAGSVLQRRRLRRQLVHGDRLHRPRDGERGRDQRRPAADHRHRRRNDHRRQHAQRHPDQRDGCDRHADRAERGYVHVRQSREPELQQDAAGQRRRRDVHPGHQHGDAGLPGRQRDAGRGQPVHRWVGRPVGDGRQRRRHGGDLTTSAPRRASAPSP